ncbi:MAG: type II toxin-antitoxin system HicA family toxin [Chloroflexota bacterium]|nr:type II toxin-antitoxin system HicA family toxin [Chloroflexota bacterium]
MKVREAIRIVEEDGWVQVRTSGDHRIFHHPFKRGSVTIPGRLGGDLDAWLWSSIRRQAQL